MTEQSLHGRRILIVEDEYMLADELCSALDAGGAIVVGPAGTVADAMTLIDREEPIDGAILDANLGGEFVYPAADRLVAQGVAIVFVTGYDASMIPERFGGYPRCEKPISMHKVLRAVGRVLQA